MGLYDHLDTDQLELGTRDRMKLATMMSTDMLLRKAFANRPSPVGSTVVDMGSGFGSTARAAVRQYDCNVSGRAGSTHSLCPALSRIHVLRSNTASPVLCDTHTYFKSYLGTHVTPVYVSKRCFPCFSGVMTVVVWRSVIGLNLMYRFELIQCPIQPVLCFGIIVFSDGVHRYCWWVQRGQQ